MTAATRRALLEVAAASAGALLAAAAPTVHAQQPSAPPWPTRPVRLIVPFAPGGPTDVMARVLAAGLAGPLGQAVVVENRPGAGGNVGTAQAARAAPDGHALLVASTGFAVNASLFRIPGYDPVRDFAPVTALGASPNVVLARPDSGVADLAGLVARAKAAPGGLDMAHPGLGSTPQLTIELLQIRAGVAFVQVPHQSAALAIQSLLGGTTPVGVTAMPAALAQVRAGALRALATTGAARWPDLPDVPTMVELGHDGFVLETWQALLAPAGTPEAVVARLAREAAAALAEPAARERLTAAGYAVIAAGPEALARRIAAEVPMWRDLIQRAGIPQE